MGTCRQCRCLGWRSRNRFWKSILFLPASKRAIVSAPGRRALHWCRCDSGRDRCRRCPGCRPYAFSHTQTRRRVDDGAQACRPRSAASQRIETGPTSGDGKRARSIQAFLDCVDTSYKDARSIASTRDYYVSYIIVKRLMCEPRHNAVKTPKSIARLPALYTASRSRDGRPHSKDRDCARTANGWMPDAQRRSDDPSVGTRLEEKPVRC